MAINLKFEPEELIAGVELTIRVEVDSPEARKVRVTEKDNSFEPSDVVIVAPGKVVTTVITPQNKQEMIVVVAVLKEGDLEIERSESGKLPIKSAVSPEAIDYWRKKSQEAQTDADGKRRDADKLRAQLQELEKAVTKLQNSSRSYETASKTIRDRKRQLTDDTSARLGGLPLNDDRKNAIKAWRNEKSNSIANLQREVADDSVQDAEARLTDERKNLDKAKSAYERVSVGLDKGLTEYAKTLDGLEKEISEAKKSGDSSTEYFLLLELQDELTKLKDRPENLVDTSLYFALTKATFETQYNIAWSELEAANTQFGRAEEHLNEAKRQREEKRALLAGEMKNRKPDILKQIKG